ncbi:MAG: cation diffusion facilitator family transporter [Acidimicrobiales bacterium]
MSATHQYPDADTGAEIGPGGPLLSAGAAPATEELRARGRRLEAAATAWNTLEAAVTVGLGLGAGSIALVAFGLDSAAEVFASLVVLWHLRRAATPGHGRAALRLVSAAFLAAGLYQLAAGLAGLASGVAPARSPAGIAFLGLTALVMASLARAKRRVGQALGSAPLAADATMSFLDAVLAAGVLVALALDLAFGWWWADPAAALAVSGVALRAGISHWREAAAPGV